MSHFPVLVVGDDLEAQLAPYDENQATAPRREYLNGDLIARMAKYYELNSADLPALAEKMDEWKACPGGVDAKGLYALTSYNADAKWDWYEVGGRWRGFLKLKDGARGALQSPSGTETAPGDVPEDKPGYADAARKGDVDFDGMRDAAETAARETWRLYAAAIAGTPVHAPWSAFHTRVAQGDITMDDARLEYQNQPRVSSFYAARELTKRLGIFASPDDFPSAEHEYVARSRAEAITTFAYVIGGEWHERGEMGWFGVSTNEKSAEAWAQEYTRMLDALPNDTLLTIVDCHI